MARNAWALRGLFVLVLIGCGRGPTEEEKIEFRPYLVKFSEYAKQYGRPVSTDVKVVFGNLYGRHLGVCEQGFLVGSRVEINRSAWKSATDVSREAMIFHELGHCLLNRDHLDGNVRAGMPSSLMATHGVPALLYHANRDYYLSELFSGG